MGKIQFPNLRALPAGPRWLAYGVLLLCAILVGGVITAYGGMLLVVLMWAVCMGGLCLLLTAVSRYTLPALTVPLLVVTAVFAALLVAMIALVLTASTPALVLFGFFICYAVSGSVMVLVRAGRRRPAANAAPAVPPAGISASARDDDTPSA